MSLAPGYSAMMSLSRSTAASSVSKSRWASCTLIGVAGGEQGGLEGERDRTRHLAHDAPANG